MAMSLLCLRRLRRWHAPFTTVFAAMVVCANQSRAEEWKFELAPYVWPVNVDGSTNVGGDDAPVDENITDRINAAFFGYFAASKNDWKLFVDGIFADVTATEGSSSVDTTMSLFEGGVKYRVAEGASDSGKRRTLEVLAGGRLTSVDVKIKEAGVLLADGDESWGDPFFGAEFQAGLSEKWSVGVRGDIGGFGAGSDFSWHAYGLFGYRFNRALSLILGYKALFQDFEDGQGDDKFKWDVTVHGPVLGLAIQW